MSEEVQEHRSIIITPNDQERWPMLEMSSQPCSMPLSNEDEQAIGLMDAVLENLDTDAAGLAAVQVGYPRRIFLLRNGVNQEGEAFNQAYINPTVVRVSDAQRHVPEACLSLPHVAARVKRPKSLTLQYFNLDGELQEEEFHGFWAQAVMHEIDHLNGTLLTNYLHAEIAKRVPRNKFGMKLTPHRENVIAQRRAKSKNARRARRLNRA
jgi:peptide deformylase